MVGALNLFEPLVAGMMITVQATFKLLGHKNRWDHSESRFLCNQVPLRVSWGEIALAAGSPSVTMSQEQVEF